MGKDIIFNGTFIRNNSGISQNNANFCIIDYCNSPRVWFFRSKKSAIKVYRNFLKSKCKPFAYQKENKSWFLCYSIGEKNDFFNSCYKNHPFSFINN